MTTEEKAKAYDEALRKAMEIKSKILYSHLSTESCEAISKYIDEIIPELRESEDERIRKELLEFLDCSIFCDELDEKKLASWIAWLEKQKEPENVSASTTIPSFHEELTEFELVLFNAVLDNNFVGTKGSENALTMTKKVAPALLAIAKKGQDWNKKPCLTCQEYEKGHKQGYTEGCTAGYNKAMKDMEQKEQKPAEWSDSFEEAVADLIEKAKQGKCDSLSPIEEGNKLLAIAKHGKVNQQEWSEEDEAILDSLIRLYSKEYVGEIWPWANGAFTYGDVVNFLKSLRPPKDCSGCAKHLEGYISGRGDAENKLLDQFGILIMPEGKLHMKPRWKPSEEQMKGLKFFLDFHRPQRNAGTTNWREYDAVESLYEQLKKL